MLEILKLCDSSAISVNLKQEKTKNRENVVPVEVDSNVLTSLIR